MLFQDRHEAGRELASKLMSYANKHDVVVLALPRGGVPVAFEVAQALQAPLDIFLVRKLGVPMQPELAMGAIASGGVRVLNEDIVNSLRISDDIIDAVAHRELVELERRENAYREDRPAHDVHGQVVILVDDGLATGSTMRAAVKSLCQQGPARIVVAVPVAASEVCAEFQNEADEVICARTPEPFYAVGACYSDFSQTTDEEVRELLEQAAGMHAAV